MDGELLVPAGAAGSVDPQVVLALHAECSCSLCGEYYKDPVMLPCACVFCHDCVAERLDGPGIYKSVCPACDKPCYAKDMSRHYKLRNLVELVCQMLIALPARARVYSRLRRLPSSPVAARRLHAVQHAARAETVASTQ